MATDSDLIRERNRTGPLQRARDLVRDRGVEVVHYCLVSVNGRVLTKAVPARHPDRNAERGVQFHATAVADLTTDRHGRLLGGGAAAPELTALPELDTLVPLPWDPEVALVQCRLFVRDDDAEQPGTASPLDVRALLARRMAEFTAGTGLELNRMYDRADRTADRLVLHRLVCRQVGRELGLTPTSMPKPATGVMGNGCHHNLSLWDGDRNVLADPGRTSLHLTDPGRHAVAGLLTHAAGGMAVYAPTVNSYKRFWDAGLFAPADVDWGLDDKTCTVRVSGNGRLEFKIPDASVNPYLSHAVVLAGIADGLRRGLDPGPPVDRRPDAPPRATDFAPLPLTLGDAVERLVADDVVTTALGPELTGLFVACKRDEWARACAAVTEWDREMYLEFLP